MVLPTQVNIINDSSQRIKVKIDNDKDPKYDEITNIEPGGRFEVRGSVSGPGKYDVVIDIITNPPGPDNNEMHGTFKFDNPAFGYPHVDSDDFLYVYKVGGFAGYRAPTYGYAEIYRRNLNEGEGLRSAWGILRSDRPVKGYPYDTIDVKDFEELSKEVSQVYSQAPLPLFTIEAFMHDRGAKTWDLRIASDLFLPSPADIPVLFID